MRPSARSLSPSLPCALRVRISAAAFTAASIVAKVTRDRLMIRLGGRHPGYGFERHMGYSTPEHKAALLALGPCEHHRRSFAPVRLAYERLNGVVSTDEALLLFDEAAIGAAE